MKINKLTGERDSTSRSSIFAEAKTAHGLKAQIITRFSPKYKTQKEMLKYMPRMGTLENSLRQMFGKTILPIEKFPNVDWS